MKDKVKKIKQKSKLADFFTNLTLRGLKQEVITRGIDFDTVLSSSIPDLQNWLYHNFRLPKDNTLLAKYDDYIDQLLNDIGQDEKVHPTLRLSYIGDRSEDFELLEKKPKKVKEIKEKVVKKKTEQGIYSGTKKALTYELQSQGKTQEETIEKVIETFPDASEKSIKIWFRKATKGK